MLLPDGIPTGGPDAAGALVTLPRPAPMRRGLGL